MLYNQLSDRFALTRVKCQSLTKLLQIARAWQFIDYLCSQRAATVDAMPDTSALYLCIDQGGHASRALVFDQGSTVVARADDFWLLDFAADRNFGWFNVMMSSIHESHRLALKQGRQPTAWQLIEEFARSEAHAKWMFDLSVLNLLSKTEDAPKGMVERLTFGQLPVSLEELPDAQASYELCAAALYLASIGLQHYSLILFCQSFGMEGARHHSLGATYRKARCNLPAFPA